MSPTAEQTKIPTGYTMTLRPTCQPMTDERAVLRDQRGRVVAVVEAWTPDRAVN